MNRSLLFASLVVLFAVFLTVCPASAQDENLSVISEWLLHSDAENALYHHLVGEAYDHLDRRRQRIAALRSRTDWEERQAHVRRVLDEVVGPFPEKTPLNPQITRTIEKDGFSVEHLIYHPHPDFPVTASLFLPENLDGEAPGILFCTGHSQASYDRPLYQQVILNLVRKGFVVFAYDPISQGERVQYLNPETGESVVGGSTAEHSHPAVQAFLTGHSQARHVVWEGIRAVDYMLSRDEIDPNRIGVHGLSGGGTQSAYIGAFDPRVRAVASSNYLVGYRRLLESIGPQDGEQIFYHGLARGLDHPDFFEVRAPKPSMLIATTRDYFSIEGAQEIYAEMKQAYAAFGAAENVELLTDDYEHGYTEKTREGIYDFFQRHLDHPSSSEDLDVQPLSPEEMRVTTTGQAQSSKFKGETVFTLNRRAAGSALDTLDQSRDQLSTHLSSVPDAARNLSGYERPAPGDDPVFRGRYHRDGYVLEKYFINGEGDYAIPYLLMIPSEGANGKAVLYLHPDGKTAEAAPGGAMERFVEQGYTVLAPDLLGIGEMGPGEAKWTYEDVPYQHWFTGVLAGRSIAGIRAGDIVRLANTLETQSHVHAREISAVARGNLCSALLHASAFEAGISNLALIEPLISYRSLVLTRLYDPTYVMGTVAGALPSYDLPDLAATLAPSRLLMVNPINGSGEPAGDELLDREYEIVRRAYERAEASGNFEVRATEAEAAEVVGSWLGETR